MASININIRGTNVVGCSDVPMECDERSTCSSPSGHQDTHIGRARAFLNEHGVERSSPGFEKMIATVEAAMKGDGRIRPTGSGMNTVLCLDTSEDVGEEGIKTLKETVLGFVSGIAEIDKTYNTTENIAVVSFGGQAKILQPLCKDYAAIRQVIETMAFGGKASMFEALLVCLCEIIERAPVTKIGENTFRPRIIIVTAGKTIDVLEDDNRDEESRKTNSERRFLNLLTKLDKAREGPKPLVFIAQTGGNNSNGFLQDRQDTGYCLLPCEKLKNLCKYQRSKEIEEDGYAQLKIIAEDDNEIDETKVIEVVNIFAGDWEDLEMICDAVARRINAFIQRKLTERNTERSRSRTRSTPQQRKEGGGIRIAKNVNCLQIGRYNQMFPGGLEANDSSLSAASKRSRSRSELRSDSLDEDGDSSDVKGTVIHGNVRHLQSGRFNQMFTGKSGSNGDSTSSQVPPSSRPEHGSDVDQTPSVDILGSVECMQVGSHNKMISTESSGRDNIISKTG